MSVLQIYHHIPIISSDYDIAMRIDSITELHEHD